MNKFTVLSVFLSFRTQTMGIRNSVHDRGPSTYGNNHTRGKSNAVKYTIETNKIAFLSNGDEIWVDASDICEVHVKDVNGPNEVKNDVESEMKKSEVISSYQEKRFFKFDTDDTATDFVLEIDDGEEARDTSCVYDNEDDNIIVLISNGRSAISHVQEPGICTPIETKILRDKNLKETNVCRQDEKGYDEEQSGEDQSPLIENRMENGRCACSSTTENMSTRMDENVLRRDYRGIRRVLPGPQQEEEEGIKYPFTHECTVEQNDRSKFENNKSLIWDSCKMNTNIKGVEHLVGNETKQKEGEKSSPNDIIRHINDMIRRGTVNASPTEINQHGIATSERAQTAVDHKETNDNDEMEKENFLRAQTPVDYIEEETELCDEETTLLKRDIDYDDIRMKSLVERQNKNGMCTINKNIRNLPANYREIYGMTDLASVIELENAESEYEQKPRIAFLKYQVKKTRNVMLTKAKKKPMQTSPFLLRGLLSLSLPLYSHGGIYDTWLKKDMVLMPQEHQFERKEKQQNWKEVSWQPPSFLQHPKALTYPLTRRPSYQHTPYWTPDLVLCPVTSCRWYATGEFRLVTVYGDIPIASGDDDEEDEQHRVSPEASITVQFNCDANQIRRPLSEEHVIIQTWIRLDELRHSNEKLLFHRMVSFLCSRGVWYSIDCWI